MGYGLQSACTSLVLLLCWSAVQADAGAKPETGTPADQAVAADDPINILRKLKKEPHPGFRDTLADGGQGPVMLNIAAGEFQMGDRTGVGLDDEVPVHKVFIERPFAIGKYEITFAEYDRFCKATGRLRPMDWAWGRGNYPVFHVSYFDAVAYTGWLSEQTGHHYRLPTEAEWEYAARAGTNSNYWWGDFAGRNRANCYDCAGDDHPSERTTIVGMFPANPWGLHDTQGNVFEWTSSVWSPSYDGRETSTVTEEELQVQEDHVRQPQIVMRGGAWNLRSQFIRSASRYRGAPQARSKNLGFRVVRDVEE